MQFAQFGSSTVRMNRPVWLGALASQEVEERPTAKEASLDTPWADYGLDGYGADRGPQAMSESTITGTLYCTHRHTLSEFERQLRRYVNTKDYLIGYQYASCRCGACGPCLRYCHVCGSERAVRWFAKRARLYDANVLNRVQEAASDRNGTYDAKLTFKADTHWQLMDTNRWAWGVPYDQAHTDEDYDLCNPRLVNEFHWPCNLDSCTVEPPYRFYRRARTWIQNYCVGYWTAGRWIRASIGGQALVNVMGDVAPLSRMAFTNFSELTVRVCSPTGFEYSFTVDQVVGEPQYLLISPHMPPQIRYCPVHDDECLDAVPGSYAEIAQEGTPVAVESCTTPVIGKLYPGRNVVYFDGFRLPGHPFHWSYDLIPCYL
jgi:hypothetical protein